MCYGSHHTNGGPLCRDIEHEYDLAASSRSMTISGSLLAWRLCLTELAVPVCIEWYADVLSCAMRVPPSPSWLQRPPSALNPKVPLFDVSSRVFTVTLRCRCGVENGDGVRPSFLAIPNSYSHIHTACTFAHSLPVSMTITFLDMMLSQGFQNAN